jgi:hypothetical protein
VRLIPTGECWCGCGKEVPVGAFFSPGHDKTAESRVIREVFGDVATFVAAFGYAPDGSRPVDARYADKALIAVMTSVGEKLEDVYGLIKRMTRSK